MFRSRRQPSWCLSSLRLSIGARHVSTRRPVLALEEYVHKKARPISLRQLTFFGRVLTENRLLGFANYVRTELPIRLAHRIRDMQKLPYIVVTNRQMSHVYDIYVDAFETLRSIPQIKTLEDNERFCDTIRATLSEHLSVIPSLGTAVIECRNAVNPDTIDRFMNIMLRSRISRRVIAEQHLALTKSFHGTDKSGLEAAAVPKFVGDVFLRCKVKDVIEQCGQLTKELIRKSNGLAEMPEIVVKGHLDATFPYIPSHLEYIVGEILRNSVQATTERHEFKKQPLHPIEVLICEAMHHVTLRFSDRGGGIPTELQPHIWSFSKGPRKQMHMKNLLQVPQMAATLQDIRLKVETPIKTENVVSPRPPQEQNPGKPKPNSLAPLTGRPPDLRLGMGLPMSRVYAEFWAGSLELQNLEGYGVDAFLQISKLGNQSEQFDYKSEFGMLDY